ncbi:MULTISPECIES: DUF3892 domain-containing protein [Rahnella]|uniref:DUF3892 domain-containing protein n=1 Tax=Rahnella TaxID=34037 RepID=UPI001C25A2B2|nr:DUF3892 domain-containing protein [Rahnella rivi]MBU9832453.1 DUF3892 domain-containing protein [Rahnella rivi]
MSDVQITCITLSSTNKVHEHITHVGSPNFTPQGSKMTVAQVVNHIENKTHTFFVQAASAGRADVGVVDPGNGSPKFIRTYADGKWNNNLLSLPLC